VSARDIRRELRRQKKALRAAMAETRARLRAELARNPAIRARAQKRRRRAAVTACGVLLIALAFLQRCACGPPPPAVPGPARDAGSPDAGRAFDAGQPRLKTQAPGRQHRPMLPIEPQSGPSWIDEFRLQVAARSTKLATCFRGQDKPGAVRWTTSVDPVDGLVSDPEFELLDGSFWLPGQRECLIHALSSPRYRLTAGAVDGGPTGGSRVTIVLEF
jgi:hypothetical protein